VPAGPELVRSLMRELGLEPCQPRPWGISLTEGDGQEHDIPDLVDRDFTADAPGAVGTVRTGSTWTPRRTGSARRIGTAGSHQLDAGIRAGDNSPARRPSGIPMAYIEVPFTSGEKNLRPDGGHSG
jgi:hypothetical protein